MSKFSERLKYMYDYAAALGSSGSGASGAYGSGYSLSPPWTPLDDSNLQDWFDGRDLTSTASPWTSRKLAVDITEATNPPSVSGNIVTFDGTNDILSRSKAPAVFVRATSLPNASGAAAGFSCTGLVRAPDGTWWVGNDGREDDSDLTFESSLVHLSADFSFKLGEIILAPLYSGIESVQGVAYDTSDDTLWFADISGQAIRHITLSGVPITDDEITGLGYDPNGLAYKASNDRLFVGRTTGGTAAIEQRSCVDGTVAATNTVGTVTDRDQFYYDDASDVLWISRAANGSPADIDLWRVGATYTVATYSLADADAVEGIYVVGNKLFVLNNGRFHAASVRDAAEAMEFNIVQPYSSVVDIWAVVAVPTFAATSDVIFIIEEPLSTIGFGVYAASLTAINIFANTLVSSTSQRASLAATSLPSLTSYRIIYARIDCDADLISLWVDGGTPQTASASVLVPPLWYGRNLRLGGANSADAGASARFCNMTLKSIGVNCGAGSRQKIEGYLAHSFGLNGNLPADHPYRHKRP